jgi:hypothetical protein
MAYVYAIVPSPVGALKVVASDRGLAAILWENDDPGRVRLDVVAEDPSHPVLREVSRQLASTSRASAEPSWFPSTWSVRSSRRRSGRPC